MNEFTNSSQMEHAIVLPIPDKLSDAVPIKSIDYRFWAG